MSSRSNDDNAVLAIILVIGAAVAFVVWKFAETFGLDFRTAGDVLLRLAVVGITLVGCWKFGDDFEVISLANTWPIFLAALWWCCWPALDYKASLLVPEFLRFGEETRQAWWSAWYTKAAGLLVLGGSGYGVKAALARY